MKVDRLDRKIIKHLQENARMSLKEMGRKLGVPHATVFTRVDRLMKRGIIKRFSAVLYPHEIGLRMGVIVINLPVSESKKIAERIAEFDEVLKVFRTFDGKIIVKTILPDKKNYKGLEEFLRRLEYPTEVYLINRVVKFDHSIREEMLEDVKL